MKSQNLLTKMGPHKHPQLVTEANDFNKLFHIEFQGDRKTAGVNILQVLSPDTQEKLIDFWNTAGPFELLFMDNTIFVVLEDDSELYYTNFLKKVALDPRDAKIISERMTDVINLANAILSCVE